MRHIQDNDWPNKGPDSKSTRKLNRKRNCISLHKQMSPDARKMIIGYSFFNVKFDDVLS